MLHLLTTIITYKILLPLKYATPSNNINNYNPITKKIHTQKNFKTHSSNKQNSKNVKRQNNITNSTCTYKNR